MRYINTFYLFIFCFYAVGVKADVADSLKALLDKPSHDTVRLSVLYALLDELPTNEWQDYNEQYTKISEEKLKDKTLSPGLRKVYSRHAAQSYYNHSLVYYEKADVVNALVWLDKSYKMAELCGLKSLMADCSTAMSMIIRKNGDLKKANEHNYSALKLYEETGDSLGIANVLNSIGGIYFDQKDYKSALASFMKSLQISEKEKADQFISISLEEAGHTYMAMEDYDNAIIYYRKALRMQEKSGYIRAQVSLLGSIGMLYEHKNVLDSAERYFKAAALLGQQLNDKEVMCRTYYTLATLYSDKGEDAKAVDYAKKSLGLGKEMKYLGKVKDAAFLLYLIYKKQGKDSEALKMFEYSVKARDSLTNQETQKAIIEQKLQYEFEKKELIIKNGNEKKLAALKLDSEKEKARKNTWIIALVSISLLLLVASFFLSNYFRQRSIIAQQKENILRQKLLVSQMNPHFIFNSLNAIQNYIFKQDSLKAGTYLSQFAELMRMILDYSRRDLITLAEEIRLLNNYFELQQLRFQFKFDYSIRVSDDLEPENVQIPPMLAQPFIENAIEHGIFYKEGKGNVNVRISKSGDKLVYEIEDDGIGLERSMELNSQKKMAHKSLATEITKERIDSMEQNSSDNAIEITDLVKLSPEHTGVKVKFVIPFKEV